jgi:hypothetical protein
MTLIIDVFRGSQAAAVKQARYDRLNAGGMLRTSTPPCRR